MLCVSASIGWCRTQRQNILARGCKRLMRLKRNWKFFCRLQPLAAYVSRADVFSHIQPCSVVLLSVGNLVQ
jgi:hypothetical protein